jgi:hypothetical protein
VWVCAEVKFRKHCPLRQKCSEGPVRGMGKVWFRVESLGIKMLGLNTERILRGSGVGYRSYHLGCVHHTCAHVV